jgi:hypothetical protein
MSTTHLKLYDRGNSKSCKGNYGGSDGNGEDLGWHPGLNSHSIPACSKGKHTCPVYMSLVTLPPGGAGVCNGLWVSKVYLFKTNKRKGEEGRRGDSPSCPKSTRHAATVAVPKRLTWSERKRQKAVASHNGNLCIVERGGASKCHGSAGGPLPLPLERTSTSTDLLPPLLTHFHFHYFCIYSAFGAPTALAENDSGV